MIMILRWLFTSDFLQNNIRVSLLKRMYTTARTREHNINEYVNMVELFKKVGILIDRSEVESRYVFSKHSNIDTILMTYRHQGMYVTLYDTNNITKILKYKIEDVSSMTEAINLFHEMIEREEQKC